MKVNTGTTNSPLKRKVFVGVKVQEAGQSAGWNSFSRVAGAAGNPDFTSSEQLAPPFPLHFRPPPGESQGKISRNPGFIWVAGGGVNRSDQEKRKFLEDPQPAKVSSYKGRGVLVFISISTKSWRRAGTGLPRKGVARGKWRLVRADPNWKNKKFLLDLATCRERGHAWGWADRSKMYAIRGIPSCSPLAPIPPVRKQCLEANRIPGKRSSAIN